ncbi:hypothetical protein [Streptomyces sp. NPDC049915]|uniref:aromatic-ring hydroxylase C-terminal domain-containing protein n=1 Tax=Streptomyces sp. NPDC049915 TaxID=3155510 RepID=UPI00344AA75D
MEVHTLTCPDRPGLKALFVRPDGYVAWATDTEDGKGLPDALEQCSARRPPPPVRSTAAPCAPGTAAPVRRLLRDGRKQPRRRTLRRVRAPRRYRSRCPGRRGPQHRAPWSRR